MRATLRSINPLFWVIAVLVIAALAYIVWDNSPAKANAAAAEECHKQVRWQLTSPSSASFTGVIVSPNYVTGTVSASNAFGVEVSHSYSCTMVDVAGRRMPTEVTVNYPQ